MSPVSATTTVIVLSWSSKVVMASEITPAREDPPPAASWGHAPEQERPMNEPHNVEATLSRVRARALRFLAAIGPSRTTGATAAGAAGRGVGLPRAHRPQARGSGAAAPRPPARDPRPHPPHDRGHRPQADNPLARAIFAGAVHPVSPTESAPSRTTRAPTPSCAPSAPGRSSASPAPRADPGSRGARRGPEVSPRAWRCYHAREPKDEIEAIRLRNFRAFRDVTLKDLPAFVVLIGANE